MPDERMHSCESCGEIEVAWEATICEYCKDDARKALRYALEDLTKEQVGWLVSEGYINEEAVELLRSR